MFSLDLKYQIPEYKAENPNWGGAACVQMAMDGYPPGANSCHVDQTTIWNTIQLNNKEPGNGLWGIGWYADPFAVTKTMNDLCPPQWHWEDVSGVGREKVLFTLLFYMANYKYPALACTFGHDYWCLIAAYETSDDPRNGNSPTLNKIWIYSPSYNGCDVREIDGPVWMQSPLYWGVPCGLNGPCGQIWNNKYVGVGEPPSTEGRIHVEDISRKGKILITPKDAIDISQKYLKECRDSESAFSLKHFVGITPKEPILVRELPIRFLKDEKEREELAVHYYVIPFGQKYEVDNEGEQLARLSVLVNAHSGRFEEVCKFSKPVRYIPEKEVAKIAGRVLRLSHYDVQNIEIEAVFSPFHQSVSTALPAYKIKSGKKQFFIDPNGKIFGSFWYNTFKGG